MHEATVYWDSLEFVDKKVVIQDRGHWLRGQNTKPEQPREEDLKGLEDPVVPSDFT